MIVKNKSKDFDPCPEYTGRAVCVDITPLKKTPSQFGERETFRFVFEVDQEQEDGKRFCVWSAPMTPTLNEKANLRKFLRGWMGRDFNQQELDGFDTEQMIHVPCFLVVTHTVKDSDTYANIASCTPYKGGDPLKPSGKFVRAKDREQTGGAGSNYRRVEQPGSTPAPAPQPAASASTAAAPALAPPLPAAAAPSTDWASTKVHVGKCKGLELRDLAPEQIQPLIDRWMPDAMKANKLTADDRRLVFALEAYTESRKATVPAEDNVPY